MSEGPISAPIRGADARASSNIGCTIVLAIVGAIVLLSIVGAGLGFISHLGEPNQSEVVAVLEEAEASAQTLTSAATKELQAAGADSLLSPEELAKDPTLAKSLAKIAKIRGIVARVHGQAAQIPVEARAKVGRLFKDERKRSVALKEYDKGAVNGRAARDRVFAAEDRLVDDLEKAALFLKAHRGQWTIRGGRLMFYNDRALNDMRALGERIEADRSELKHAMADQQAEHNRVREDLGLAPIDYPKPEDDLVVETLPSR